MTRYQNYIGGQWKPPVSHQWFETHDPSTGKALGSLARGTAADIDLAVQAGREAFAKWAGLDGVERGRLLAAIGRRILKELEWLAELESRDTGKPLSQAKADVRVASRYFEFYAGLADKFGGSTIPVPGPFLDYMVREPLGVVGVIIPWNYPLQIGARAIAAPLAVGNVVVLKPAEEASLSVLELARICLQESIPSGVINVVTGFGEEAGAPLAAHPDLGHLTFTGSLEIGRKVAAAAAANVVPVTLELGGKSPHIVFGSADLDRAVPIIVQSFLQNAGQTCSAGSRILVDETRHEELLIRLKRRLQDISMGPGITDPDLGPVISWKQRERVEQFIRQAEGQGASVWQCKNSVEPPGYYVAPTLVDGVRSENTVFQEEIFGPVASVTTFSTETEAIRLANATRYGLVAAVWTSDVGQAHRMALRIKGGQVFINSYGAGGGVEMPFGGYGQSGYGREKGIEALYQYTQVKNVTVYIGE